MSAHRGHCRCGGVVIHVTGEPEISVYCHCDDCRRSAGAPLIAAVGFERSVVAWEAQDTLARWKNGSCTRLFCRHCGSPVAQEHESAPTRIFFNTAFMDEPALFPPTAHSFGPEQLPWLGLSDDLPRAEKTISIKTP